MAIIDNLTALLGRGPDGALLRYGLGNEYLKQGDPVRAAEHLAVAVRLDPAYSAAWKLYGRALAEAGRPAEALAAFDTGISVAEARGDAQAAREMQVFRKRALKAQHPPDDQPAAP